MTSMKQKYLLVIDVQNDFVSGSLGSEAAQAVLDNICRKVEAFDGTVMFTRDTHAADYLDTQEGKYLPVPHCIKGTEGWELVDRLKQYAEEHKSIIYDKPAFGNIYLASDIKSLSKLDLIDSVELIGLDTDICVISNALIIKAAVPELPVYVDPSCCAGSSKERHEAAIEVMKSCQVIMNG